MSALPKQCIARVGVSAQVSTPSAKRLTSSKPSMRVGTTEGATVTFAPMLPPQQRTPSPRTRAHECHCPTPRRSTFARPGITRGAARSSWPPSPSWP
ncbi:MAG: hypothetical protein U0326_13865 [Polyangiales bacterium]